MNSETKAPDERMWAALAHATILINLTTIVAISTIGAMAIWLFKRKSSKYVGYQALQAFIFQAAVVFVAILIGFPGLIFGWLILLAGSAYGAYGAYRCYNGYDFRYAWLGKFIMSMRTRQ